MRTQQGVQPSTESADPTCGRTLAAPGQDGSLFWVLERNLPELVRRIERLARRAQRLGTGRLTLRDTGRRDGDRACVVLEGHPSALAGWTLAAIVDHRDEGSTLRVVTSIPGELDRKRLEEARCDHCRLRRRRAETFVVWHAATRRVRQVGSGCLRDFLDGHDPERLCRQADYLLLAQRELRVAATRPAAEDVAERGVPLAEFAAHAAHALRVHGWVSRQRARESAQTATADSAQSSLESTPDAPDAFDRALANAALRWAGELLAARDQLSDFERDAVAVVGASTLMTARERGLVCALIEVYRQRRARSRHLGTPGDWVEVVVLVERVVETHSCRHVQLRRHDLVDVDGNRLVWWQTRGAALPVGAAIHVRAHVRRHTRFGRMRVTVLDRCRMLDRRLG
jgi:hypothetical protein